MPSKVIRWTKTIDGIPRGFPDSDGIKEGAIEELPQGQADRAVAAGLAEEVKADKPKPQPTRRSRRDE
jgi:hypothetical protein